MIGLILTLVGVFVSVILHGISPIFLFMEFGSIIIVVMGCFGATISSFPWTVTQTMGKVIGKALKGGEKPSAAETIKQIVHMTTRARGEGLLALEEEAKKIEDPYFKKGLALAVDGTDPDQLKKTMFAEIIAMKERHKLGAAWCEKAGVYAPTFGIIGAVFGLISTMSKLSQPNEVGAGIAGAFVATFWGVFIANGIFLPWSAKLKQISADEVAHKQLIVEGVMAIQAGVSPRIVEEMLMSHVPPAEREETDGAAERAAA
ncbi:MAG: motility protein [Actinomycetia bacterium]|nr:motility protein [Actinomycetes bacterium]